MVNQLVTQLVTQQKINDAAGIIHDYRQQGQDYAEHELAQALARLQSNHDVETVLREFSHRLTQKLLHPMSLVLRQAAQEEEPTQIEWLQENLADIFQKQRKPH